MSARKKALAVEWLKDVPPALRDAVHAHCLEEATRVLVHVVRTLADDPLWAGRNGREALLILADTLDNNPPKTETH